jgi:fibronectin-binding autotransporter adhesin
MAFITAETRSDIVELAMGMLNQAPSTTLLNTLISKTTGGASLQDLADYIATTDAFTAQYPATQTAREFATEMFGKLITGGTLAADVNTLVIDTLEGLLNSGTTKAQGFVAVIDFLSNPANASHVDLGDIAKSFQNRADAAEYYSVTKELGGSSDAQLAAAIASVTSDAATLTAANTAADSASGVVIVSTSALTISAADTLTGSAGNDAFTGATTGAIATYAAGDSITDSSSTDNDSLTLEINNDTAALAAVRNVETVNVNVNTTTASGSGNADDVSFAATNMQGVKTYNFDVTKAVSAVSQVLLVDAEDGSTVNATADFREVDVEVETAGDDVTINAAAAGTRGTPAVVTVTNSTVPGDVIITGAGYLTVDSDMATASGLLKVTAGNNLSMDGDGAAIIDATSTSGSVTLTDATDAIAVITNSAGNTSIAGTGAGSVNATAGGSVSLTGTILSTSATLNAAGISAISGTADGIVSAVLSGNGAAATYAFTGSHDALAEIVTTGAQDVTISVIPVDIGGALTITNGNDGATNLTLATTAGAVNLSDGQLLDNVKVSVDNGGSTLTTAAGQNVQIATDQGASAIAVGKAASAA